MIYKTLHGKLKIEQHGPHLKPCMNSGDLEGEAVPVSHWATVVLLLLYVINLGTEFYLLCCFDDQPAITWERVVEHFPVIAIFEEKLSSPFVVRTYLLWKSLRLFLEMICFGLRKYLLLFSENIGFCSNEKNLCYLSKKIAVTK
jgi:hypothetical protein